MMGRETVICVCVICWQGQEILKGVITELRYKCDEDLTLIYLEPVGRQENARCVRVITRS